ncbi:MAG TPA: hypothetical protein PL000_11885 [Anaerolineales bacterium]|nr:hypothetical protein [Anaerolineales bacterium]
MSWKPEIKTSGEDWNTNATRFETEAEAVAAAKDIFTRWMLATDYRAAPSDDPVSYKWDPEKGLVNL